MKIITLLLALFFCTSALSESQCSQYDAPLLAAYHITVSVKGENVQQQILQLIRTKNKVVYHYPEQEMSEQWFLQKNNNMRLTRYFEEHQRGIEYQAADMPNLKQANDSWLQKYQLVSPAFMAQLNKTESPHQGCTFKDTFQSVTGHQPRINLAWNSYYQLPLTLVITQNQQTTTWRLFDLQSNEQQIVKMKDKYDHFKLTDYSDIGDNEADPFLAKMINQGFIEHSHSGFYSADGGTM